MALGAQSQEWKGTSRRRVERFELTTPVDVTVLRSGVPDTVPGRSVNVCEIGIAAMLSAELLPGETVGIEVQLPASAEPLRARAVVKYQDKLRCGLEFLGLSAEEVEAIRDSASGRKAEVHVSSRLAIGKMEKNRSEREKKATKANPGYDESGDSRFIERSGKKAHPVWIMLLALLVLAGFGAGVFWWRWNRGWEQLEAGLKGEQAAATQKPEAQVPAEVMEKLLVHRVEPLYPAEARRANLQGVIALDIVIGRDGSVVSMKALNGPDVLVRSAMDALRWWKFDPYRLNGEPAVVETTVAVEFKR
jgi:TonB family protein